MAELREKREKKVGVKDIAREAGVAISTVSHALNGTASISDDIRNRVIDTARRLGYLHQRRARATISTLQSIMLVVPATAAIDSETNFVTWTILESVRQISAQRGIRVIPYVAPDVGGDAAEIRKLAEQEDADAIIVFHEDLPEFVRDISVSGRPVVLVNGVDPAMLVDCVTPANRFGARLATQYLLDLGHRRITHVTFGDRRTIRQRLTGYQDSMRAAGIEISKEMIIHLQHFEPSVAEEAICGWVQQGGMKNGTTAIFCAADNLALGTLRALAAAGIRVPQDMSVLGFDDILLGELAKPPLSSVKIPLRSMGEAALEMAEQRLIANDARRPSQRLELGCTLVTRASCAPPHEIGDGTRAE